jgi:uncharacterized membrane protein YccF (DUF307 family)
LLAGGSIGEEMSFLGNLLWLIFGGIFPGLGYLLGGLALCLTIVGIPFGVRVIKLGLATMSPFGKELHEEEMGSEFLNMVFNVVWVVVFGWEIALAHLTAGLLLAITIVGLPFARQHMKLIPMSLFPFSYDLR